ncbi:40S ribosomal protein S27-like, partial [Galemys pyrenaicus]
REEETKVPAVEPQFLFCGHQIRQKTTTIFNHAQAAVLRVGSSTVLCQPKGGKPRLTVGQKQH